MLNYYCFYVKKPAMPSFFCCRLKSVATEKLEKKSKFAHFFSDIFQIKIEDARQIDST